MTDRITDVIALSNMDATTMTRRKKSWVIPGLASTWKQAQVTRAMAVIPATQSIARCRTRDFPFSCIGPGYAYAASAGWRRWGRRGARPPLRLGVPDVCLQFNPRMWALDVGRFARNAFLLTGLTAKAR